MNVCVRSEIHSNTHTYCWCNFGVSLEWRGTEPLYRRLGGIWPLSCWEHHVAERKRRSQRIFGLIKDTLMLKSRTCFRARGCCESIERWKESLIIGKLLVFLGLPKSPFIAKWHARKEWTALPHWPRHGFLYNVKIMWPHGHMSIQGECRILHRRLWYVFLLTLHGSKWRILDTLDFPYWGIGHVDPAEWKWAPVIWRCYDRRLIVRP